MAKVQLLLEVVENLRSLADSVQAVANAMMQGDAPVEQAPTQETPPPAPAKGKKIALEQVRAVLAEKSHAGLTVQVRGLLEKYGAQKLSEVDPKHYPALLADAEALTDAP